MKILDKRALENALQEALNKKGLTDKGLQDNKFQGIDLQQREQGKDVVSAFEQLGKKNIDSAQAVKNKALALLARREYTRKELEQKLLQYNFFTETDASVTTSSCHFADIIAQVVDKLIEDDLLSDQRYGEMHLRSRIQKFSGPFKIRMELRQKGVDAVLIESLLKNSDVDWFELALVAARKKVGMQNTDIIVEDMKSRAGLQRFLNSRGFSPEHIRYAIEALQTAKLS